MQFRLNDINPKDLQKHFLGDCIPLASKCNSRLDCKDGSDEAECSYLQVSNYFDCFIYANNIDSFL